MIVYFIKLVFWLIIAYHVAMYIASTATSSAAGGV